MGIGTAGGYNFLTTSIPSTSSTGTSSTGQSWSNAYSQLMAGLPDLEKKAYDVSGLGSLTSNTTLGQVDDATMNNYYDQATANAYKKSKGAYASMFSDSGAGATGVGPQVEMLSRRATELSEAKAKAQVENAKQGAQVRASAQQQAATGRYNNYMNLLMNYYKQQMSQQAGTSGVSYPNQYTNKTNSGYNQPFNLKSPWDNMSDYVQPISNPAGNSINWGTGDYNWSAADTPTGGGGGHESLNPYALERWQRENEAAGRY